MHLAIICKDAVKVHVHPLGEPGYLKRHVPPNVTDGAAKAARSPSDIAVIVPAMTIVGDSDRERDTQRESVRASAGNKYAGIATRIVLYHALGDAERFERYGEVARRLQR